MRWWYRFSERHPQLSVWLTVVGVLVFLLVSVQLSKRALREEREYYRGTRLESVYYGK
jgi:hypothetical protein